MLIQIFADRRELTDLLSHQVRLDGLTTFYISKISKQSFEKEIKGIFVFLHFDTVVVYFDQGWGVAHSKRWLKYAFLTLFPTVSLSLQHALPPKTTPPIVLLINY